jgi:hypothetical protein
MKLNRGILWGSAAAATAALVAGGLMVTVVGIDRPVDADAQIGNEQGEVEAPVAGSDDATTSVEGTEQYRGGGAARGGGGHAAGGHATARGGFGHTAWGHGGWGGRGWGHDGRGWGGGSRWGHWGGGRWAGGRWVNGPYWGWCDGRYYACNRSWW